MVLSGGVPAPSEKRKLWNMETLSSDKVCCNVAWTWQIILGWSQIVLRFVTKTLGARSESVGVFLLRAGRGADVRVGAGLGSPRQRLAGAGERQPRPLGVEGRRGGAVPLRAVLHWVPPHLEVYPPGAGCLLEDEEVLPPDLLLADAAGVRLSVRGHIRLIVHGLDDVTVLEILLGGAAIEHPLDDLWGGSSRGSLEAGSPVSWAGEDDVTDFWDKGTMAWDDCYRTCCVSSEQSLCDCCNKTTQNKRRWNANSQMNDVQVTLLNMQI